VSVLEQHYERAADNLSPAEQLFLDCPDEDAQRIRLAEFLATIPPSVREAMPWSWRWWARPSQLAPATNWRTWVVRAGRGYGKTRTGAEETRRRVRKGLAGHIALIGATAADVRDVMVEGESGILAVHPTGSRPEYEPSKRRLTWPNGATATCFSAEEPDRLRGPQSDWVWGDEPASWRSGVLAWDNAMFGHRLGNDPRSMLTMTPRPLDWLRKIEAEARTYVTTGATYDNLTNLAESFIDMVVGRYEGTRLGRQELFAELLVDTPGALWTQDLIDRHRVREAPMLQRVVVAIDPAVTAGEDSDSTGIVAAGLAADGHVYVLADRTCRVSPDAWARRAVDLYDEVEGDRIVAEVNNGGDLVETVLRTVDPSVPVRKVHASRGKRVRAEPVAALYEQGRVHHVGAELADLEDELTTWTVEASESPDRLDALVWAVTELAVEQVKRRRRSVVASSVAA